MWRPVSSREEGLCETDVEKDGRNGDSSLEREKGTMPLLFFPPLRFKANAVLGGSQFCHESGIIFEKSLVLVRLTN